MNLIALFLCAVGLLMLVKPELVWYLSEKWKSQDASEPTALYGWSIRFGGAVCVIIGIAIFILPV